MIGHAVSGLTSQRNFLRAMQAAAVSLLLIAGCGSNNDAINQAGKKEVRQRRSGAHSGGDQSDSPRRVHLWAAYRDVLHIRLRIICRHALVAIQGSRRSTLQRSASVYAPRYCGHHSKQRHSLFYAGDRPALRAHRDLSPRSSQAALLLRATHRRQYFQLRIHGQQDHRHRSR